MQKDKKTLVLIISQPLNKTKLSLPVQKTAHWSLPHEKSEEADETSSWQIEKTFARLDFHHIPFYNQEGQVQLLWGFKNYVGILKSCVVCCFLVADWWEIGGGIEIIIGFFCGVCWMGVCQSALNRVIVHPNQIQYPTQNAQVTYINSLHYYALL